MTYLQGFLILFLAAFSCVKTDEPCKQADDCCSGICTLLNETDGRCCASTLNELLIAKSSVYVLKSTIETPFSCFSVTLRNAGSPLSKNRKLLPWPHLQEEVLPEARDMHLIAAYHIKITNKPLLHINSVRDKGKRLKCSTIN